MFGILIGIGLIIVGLLLLLSFSAGKGKIEAIESTKTCTVEFLNSLAKSMSEDVGAGSLQYAAEVKGKVVCPEPIVSELAQKNCVYYSMNVQRQFEETYYERDKDGKERQKTRTLNETVSSNERSIPFYVEDATGKIKVIPGNAEFVTEKVLSRFEAAQSGAKRLSVGSFSFDLGRYPMGGDRRTLGYRFEEHAIPVGRSVYILGEATDRDGELSIGVPKDKGKFIISVKSEEELLQDEQTSQKMKKIGALACAVLGFIVLLIGVF